MLEIYLKAPYALQRFRSTTAGPYLDGFAAALHEAGYTWAAGISRLRDAVHLAQWTERRGVAIEAIDESTMADFDAHRVRCACPSPGRRCGALVFAGRKARDFVAYLRRIGVVRPAAGSAVAERPLHDMVADFSKWMRRHRGVTAATLGAYGGAIRALIDRLGDDPGRYTAQSLRSAMVEQAAGHGVSKAKQVATAFRMFLRYLAATGRCSPFLADAIPRMSGPRPAKLPRHIPSEKVEALIASCDSRTRAGLRDRAILLLLGRLALRAGDILALRLGDIDWADATVRVLGKGRREARLPLPQDAGDAILAYLEHARPKASSDRVFLTVVAPWRPLAATGTVSDIVARAIERSGVEAPTHGAHLLRHSAATAMLRKGASLSAIGVILRQHSIETTAHYARVDVGLLQQVAQPWMEAQPVERTTHVDVGLLRQVAQPWTEVSSC